jgi:hypothetical protein
MTPHIPERFPIVNNATPRDPNDDDDDEEDEDEDENKEPPVVREPDKTKRSVGNDG